VERQDLKDHVVQQVYLDLQAQRLEFKDLQVCLEFQESQVQLGFRNLQVLLELQDLRVLIQDAQDLQVQLDRLDRQVLQDAQATLDPLEQLDQI
jgi:hypothetical protein